MELLRNHVVIEPSKPVYLCSRTIDGATYFSHQWYCQRASHRYKVVPGFACALKTRLCEPAQKRNSAGVPLRRLLGAMFCTDAALLDRVVVALCTAYAQQHALAPQYAAASGLRKLYVEIGHDDEFAILFRAAAHHRYRASPPGYANDGPSRTLVVAIYQQLQLPFGFSGYYPFPLHRFPELAIDHLIGVPSRNGYSTVWYHSAPSDMFLAHCSVWCNVLWRSPGVMEVLCAASELHRLIVFWFYYYQFLSTPLHDAHGRVILRTPNVIARRVCNKVMEAYLRCAIVCTE